MSNLKTPYVNLTEKVIDTPSPVTVDSSLHVLVVLNSQNSYMTRTLNSQAKLLKYYGDGTYISSSSPEDLKNAYRLIKTVPLTIVPMYRNIPVHTTITKQDDEYKWTLLSDPNEYYEEDIRVIYRGPKSFKVSSSRGTTTFTINGVDHKFSKSELLSSIYKDKLDELDIEVIVRSPDILDKNAAWSGDENGITSTRDVSYDYNKEIEIQHQNHRVDIISDLGNSINVTVGGILVSHSSSAPTTSVESDNGDQMIYHYPAVIDSNTATFSFHVAPSTIYTELVAKAYLAGHPFGGVYAHRLGVVYPGTPTMELDRAHRDNLVKLGINVIYTDFRPRYNHVLVASNYTATTLNNPMKKESHRRLANRINYDVGMISESWIGRVINDKLYEEIVSTIKSYITGSIMCYPESLEEFDVVCDSSNNSDVDRANNIVNIELYGKFSGEVDVVNIMSVYYSLNPE